MVNNSIYLHHSSNPQNIGSLKDPTNIAEIKFDENGKDASISVFVLNQNNQIKEIRYIAKASIPIVASLSYLSDHLKGKKVADALSLKTEDVVKALSLPDHYMYCAKRALEAIQKVFQESEDPFDRAFKSISEYNGPYEKNQPMGFED